MSLRHILIGAVALACSAAAQAGLVNYSFVAKGLDAATGGTLSGSLVVDMDAVDSDAGPTRGLYDSGAKMSGGVSGGVQDGMAYTNESKRIFVDADMDSFFSFIDLNDPWPVFQLFLEGTTGVDALTTGAMPYLYLEDFQSRHEIRFQMPNEKQYRYEITALTSTDVPPRDGAHELPLPGTAPLVLAALLGLGWARRRAATQLP
ncbi:hypothetical protein [Pelomonas sp. Root1237]|uniref:hypothetical protein n=1 Tax=Pelomonas sp. Root1237 TaxID=1736434 RepID=UPI0006FCF7DA|nr:hypothetical protein [Pelomonas sp. Root1237]